MGYYQDGKVDCELKDCPIYPFMPFNPNKQKSRVLSADASKAIADRFASARIVKQAKQTKRNQKA